MASYETMIANYDAIEKMGHAITLSQMFGCTSKDQGVVIAIDCYLADMKPLEYAKRNKMLNGKPFKQYDAMLAEFHERKGKSRIISKSPDLAKIELEYNGSKEEFSLSWEDAQKEVFPYLGKEMDIVAKLAKGEKPELKPKYATPRSRGIMLFARCVSDAIRSKCPEVVYGVYTPEELEDLPGEDVVVVVPQRQAAKPPATPVPVTASPAPASETPVPLAGADSVPDDPKQDEPVSEDVAQKVLAAAKAVNQLNSGFIAKFKETLAKLTPNGKVSELPHGDAERLLLLLERKEVDAVFEFSLKKPT